MRLLQNLVDDMGIKQGPSSKLTAFGRSLLRDLEPRDGLVIGEGSFVEIAGFIASDRTIRPAGPESVNCRLRGAAANDIHIPLVEQAGELQWDSVVVEPVPQDRPSAWTADAFDQARQDGVYFRVRGQLFFDNKHQPNGDPTDPQGSEPKRFTVWELHPVTEILVCTQTPATSCDPDRPEHWQPFGQGS